MPPCHFCSPSRRSLGDFNIERSVISCMVQAPDTQVDAARRLLNTADFTDEPSALLFDIICRRHDNGELVDSTSLMAYIYDKGLQEKITPVFLSECAVASANPTNTRHFAETVLDFSRRRQMVRIASEMARAAIEGGEDESDWQSGCLGALRQADAAMMGRDGDELIHIKDVGFDYIDLVEKSLGGGVDPATPTGIKGLDSLLDGGIRREYILIGGLQGHGKSLLAMQMAGELARTGKRGLIIGYDMSPMQVFMRDLARETAVPLNQIMGRAQSPMAGMDFQAISRGISRMRGDWDVHYTKSPYITLDTAIAHARSLHRQKPLDFIILDYLQRVPSIKRKNERPDEALSAISDRLDCVQKELGCTLIAPVQLNDDGMIGGARALLNNPQVFIRIEMDTTENQDGEMEAGDNGFLRILKNRFGPKDRRIPVFRNGPFQRFEDREWSKPTAQPKRNGRNWSHARN
jgi:replicative DNA helicase